MASGLQIPKGARGGFALDDRALRRTFEKLPVRMGRKVTRKAINAAGTPILRQARKDAPVRFGFTKKAHKKRAKAYRDKVPSGIGVVIIGIDQHARFPDPLGRTKGGAEIPAFYVHFAHDGFTDRAGNWHEGDPWIKRAQQTQADEAIRRMADKLEEGIGQEAEKLRRR